MVAYTKPQTKEERRKRKAKRRERSDQASFAHKLRHVFSTAPSLATTIISFLLITPFCSTSSLFLSLKELS